MKGSTLRWRLVSTIWGTSKEAEGEEVHRTSDAGGSPAHVAGAAPGEVFRVLYLFSVAGRKGDFKDELQKAAVMHGVGVEVEEKDILKNQRSHDFLRRGVRRRVLDKVGNQSFHAVVASPPCSTFCTCSVGEW